MGGDRDVVPAAARRARRGAPVTLSLTPVLCDQLEAPGRGRALPRVPARRAPGLARARRRGGRAEGPAVARELERAAGDYARAALERAAPATCSARCAPHAAWTCAATHAVLPLLATDAGVRLQVRTGVDAHRARFGGRGAAASGCPSARYAPWLDPLLEEAGRPRDVRRPHRRLRPRRRAPPAAARAPRPGRCSSRSTARRSSSCGATAATRRTAPTATPTAAPRTTTGRGRNDGAVYDPDARGRAGARRRAPTSSRASRERVAGGGLCVCALDTELLGHWWHEGAVWLAAVVDAGRARRASSSSPLDDALADVDPAPAPRRPLPRDDVGHAARPVDVVGPARSPSSRGRRATPSCACVAAGAAAGRRARCASCSRCSPATGRSWSRRARRALPARARDGHRAALEAALADPGAPSAAVRSLAPHRRERAARAVGGAARRWRRLRGVQLRRRGRGGDRAVGARGCRPLRPRAALERSPAVLPVGCRRTTTGQDQRAGLSR